MSLSAMHYDVSDDSGDHAEHVLLRHLFDTTQSDASKDWDAVVSHRGELRSYQRDGLDCIFVDGMGLAPFGHSNVEARPSYASDDGHGI